MRRFDLSIFGRAGRHGPTPAVSRRQFFGASAGAAGAMFGSGLWTPAESERRRNDHDDDDDDDDDRDDHGGRAALCPEADPIPHVTIPPIPIAVIQQCARAHFFFPGNVEGAPAPTDPTGPQAGGRDPSTIFNFDGVIGVADLDLKGTGTDTTTGVSAPYDFHTDMRFMAGRFVATDGRVHNGAFAFI